MDFDHNDNGYRGPDEDPEEIDYAGELARDDWGLVRSPWPGRDVAPLAGVALDADLVARVLLENVGVWPGELSWSFRYFRDATPWVTSAAEIHELLVRGKTGDRRRAEGCPTSIADTEARLRLVVPTLRATPRLYWDVADSERCWERHVRDGRFQKTYKEAVLYVETWWDSFWGERLYAFCALDPSDRHVPRRALDRAVFLHVRFPDGFGPVEEDLGSFDRF